MDFLKRMNEIQFISLIAGIAAVQMILILLGALPPLASSSLGSAIFNVLTIAALAAFGYSLANKGVKHAAINGAIAMLIAVFISYVAIFIGSSMRRPVLGIAVPNDFMFYFVLLSILVINVVLGAVVVAVSAWAFSKLSKTKKRDGEKRKETKRKRR